MSKQAPAGHENHEGPWPVRPERAGGGEAVGGAGRAPRPGTKLCAAVAAIGLCLAVVVVHEGAGRHTTSATRVALRQERAAWNSISNNWSGYMETSAQTGERYREASATFVVPLVRGAAYGCASDWVGIGGATTSDLIQLGADSCASAHGTYYYAWYELLPASESPISGVRIQPGDQVAVSVRELPGPVAPPGGSPYRSAASSIGRLVRSHAFSELVALARRAGVKLGGKAVIEHLRQWLATAGPELRRAHLWAELTRDLFHPGTQLTSGPQDFLLAMRVTSPNGATETWSRTVSYRSSFSSVEWITEAPTSSAGIEALPDFGVTHFRTIAANGAAPALSAADAVLLADRTGQASVPSPPSGPNDAFNTCWFPTHSVTGCPAP